MDLGVSAAQWAARRGYESFTQARLERVLCRAANEGIAIEDLINKEKQFAIFVRMVRALEQCSNNEMADYLADLMIGGLKSDAVQSQSDLFQILMSALGSMTLTEVHVLYLMRECGLCGDELKRQVDQEKIGHFENRCLDALGIEGENIGGLVNGMMRTGLVSMPPAVLGGPFRNSNILTSLAHDLFHLLDYKKRLT